MNPNEKNNEIKAPSRISRMGTSLKGNRPLLIGLIALVIILSAGLAVYFVSSSGEVKIDDGTISAPAIDLTSTAGGVLEETYVHEGDMITANTVVARVGTELIKSKSAGEVISVHNDIGKSFSPGQAVVTVIDLSELRVVGSIQEDKGLADVQVGQRAIFTVDAFGSKTYNGIVDEVSPTANTGDVVFSISDARQEQNFDVKIRYDVSAYPELQNGMSAKIVVFKN